MDEPRIIFISHANYEHSELRRDALRRMLGTGELERMVRNFTVPVTYSTQGEDIDIYEKLSPRVIDAINSNQNVQVAKGTYAAILPTIAFGQLKSQTEEADKVLNRKLFGKIQKLRFFPEHDWHPEYCDVIGKVEPTIILDDSQNYYEYRTELPYPIRLLTKGKHVIGVSKGDERVPVLVNRGIRTPYLALFRGKGKVADIVKAFEDEIQLAKQNNEPCITFLTDHEVTEINAVNGQPRIDKWNELWTGLKESDIAQYFTHYDKVEDDILNYVENSHPYVVDRRVLTPKWQHSPKSQKMVFDAIESAERKGWMKSRYNNFVALHAPIKDVLSMTALKAFNGKPLAEQDIDYMTLTLDQLQDKQPVKELDTDLGPKVRITSDSLRLSEYQHFLKTLQNGSTLLEDVEKLDPSLQVIVKALHEIYSEK